MAQEASQWLRLRPGWKNLPAARENPLQRLRPGRSELLRKKQGDHEEDCQDDRQNQAGQVLGGHSFSTPRTTSPRTANIAMVRTTKIRSRTNYSFCHSRDRRGTAMLLGAMATSPRPAARMPTATPGSCLLVFRRMSRPDAPRRSTTRRMSHVSPGNADIMKHPRTALVAVLPHRQRRLASTPQEPATSGVDALMTPNVETSTCR